MVSLLTQVRSNITQSVTKQTAEDTSQIGVISKILLTSPEAVPVTEGPSIEGLKDTQALENLTDDLKQLFIHEYIDRLK
jgi:hypothetical protein